MAFRRIEDTIAAFRKKPSDEEEIAAILALKEELAENFKKANESLKKLYAQLEKDDEKLIRSRHAKKTMR